MAEYNESEKTFINPYNFVPIKTKLVKNINVEVKKDKLHTGCLHCSLTVWTPLVIPNIGNVSEDKDNKEHKIYSAFRINEKIVIPGSSIRGMLRSVYEAETNSCMVTINPNEHITKRTDIGTFFPCILKKDDKKNWKLFDATRIAVVGNGSRYRPLQGDYQRFDVRLDGKEMYIEVEGKKLYFGQEVNITENNLGHKKLIKKTNRKIEVWDGKSVATINAGTDTGAYLYLGEAISNKHAESVFRILAENKNINSNAINKALIALEETLKIYRSDSINRNLSSENPTEKHYGYYGYERAKKNGVIPLWYKADGNTLKLSMAAIGRIAFDNSIEHISNGHKPCISRTSLCPACAVFGMVGVGEKQNGMGSLIRLTDATCKDTVLTTKNVTLKELGSPRTSYLPFYSVDGKGYDEKEAQIRGRKFYWHIPAAANDASIYSSLEKTKRNATFELINVGNKFEFDVYYDGLDEAQLKMLLWTINLPYCNGKTLMHKLGHGKPLGLGSVELKVLSNMERTLSSGYEIQSVPTDISYDKKPKLLDEDSWSKLEKMLEFDPESKDNVSYPKIEISQSVQQQIKDDGATLKENVAASHQWFRLNNSSLPNDKSAMKVRLLSSVNEKDFDNKRNTAGKRNNNSNGNQKIHTKNNSVAFSKNGSSKSEKNGKIIWIGTDKNGNPSGKINFNGTIAKFYGDTCPDYEKMKKGDTVSAVVKGNYNNNHYTAYEVKLLNKK